MDGKEALWHPWDALPPEAVSAVEATFCDGCLCGQRCGDLPVEPRGADVTFLHGEGILVGLSSFSNRWNINPSQAIGSNN